MGNEEKIWNRALGVADAPGAGEGDVALSRLLSFHSLTMSGGLLDAVERRTADEFEEVVGAYRWMGLDAAADALAEVAAELTGDPLDPDETDALEARADEMYDSAVSDDSVVLAALRRRLESHPLDFDDV